MARSYNWDNDELEKIINPSPIDGRHIVRRYRLKIIKETVGTFSEGRLGELFYYCKGKHYMQDTHWLLCCKQPMKKDNDPYFRFIPLEDGMPIDMVILPSKRKKQIKKPDQLPLSILLKEKQVLEKKLFALNNYIQVFYKD